MDILKYFYEEPAALEVLSSDLDPDARRRSAPASSLDDLLNAPAYYRGYLAGTNLALQHTGLTALAHPEAFVDPLLDWLGGQPWTWATEQAAVKQGTAGDARTRLRTPGTTAVLACGATALDPDDLIAATLAERRYAIEALRRVLAAAEVVFFPEPAHHGHDWSLFSAQPMRASFVVALQRHPHPDVRRFVLPYRQARSEHKFYFEAHALDTYSAYEI